MGCGADVGRRVGGYAIGSVAETFVG